MKRSPIKRKTPLRSQKNQTKKLSGSNPTVPRSRSEAKRVRIQKRSKTNSRKWEDLELQQQYRDEYPLCELWTVLSEVAPEMLSKSLLRLNVTPPADDIHHIFHKTRLDVRPNLVRLCRGIHELDADHKKRDAFRVACLWVKLGKSMHVPEEFDIAELNKAYGATRPGAQPVLAWLEKRTFENRFIEAFRLKVIEGINKQLSMVRN